ncbi:unnamed protein product [Penicillium manginii]
MTKSQPKGPSEDGTAASQIQRRDPAVAEQNPRHGSHVANGTIYQGSISGTGQPEDRQDRAARGTSIHSVSVHSFSATEVGEDCWVYNGSTTNGQNAPGVRIHRMEGGSVKNGSKIHNGDMSKDEFLRFFCNGR